MYIHREEDHKEAENAKVRHYRGVARMYTVEYVSLMTPRGQVLLQRGGSVVGNVAQQMETKALSGQRRALVVVKWWVPDRNTD